MSGYKGMRNFITKGKEKIVSKTAGRLAENIDKEDFLLQLKENWRPYVKKSSDIESELVKARERINKAGPFKITFDKVGVTDDNLRKILQEIMDEKPEQIIHKEPKIGRNEPCPCRSGKKYKKCCLNKEV